MSTATMHTLTLNNGVEMPALGFGVFQTPPDETVAAVEAALAVGYRHIDTAAAYGNEREVGEGIRRSGLDRGDVFVETKVWISDYGYDETLHAFDKSAAKLATQAWSPIGGITAYRDGMPKRTFDDPTILAIAEAHGKTAAQVMLRWHIQEGRSAIPKSVRSERIAENFDVFDFELSDDEVKAIDGLDTAVRGGPEPDSITLEAYGMTIPEA